MQCRAIGTRTCTVAPSTTVAAPSTIQHTWGPAPRAQMVGKHNALPIGLILLSVDCDVAADGVTLSLNISAAATPGGARVGSAKIGGSVAPTGWFDFPILAAETELPVRVLVDRSIAEFFIGDGRAAFTARHYPRRSEGGVRVAALSAAPLTLSASVYEMGCGWVL